MNRISEWGAALEAFRVGLAEAQQDGRDVGYLSIPGNAGAEAFRVFVNTHRIGKVLDVGCGPQWKPLYLQDIPDDEIMGIEPLDGKHPFPCFKGCIEDIADNLFEVGTVICATSFDHLRDPAVAAEVMRRLARDRIVVWCCDGQATPPEQHTFAVDHAWLFSVFGPPLVQAGDFFCFSGGV